MSKEGDPPTGEADRSAEDADGRSGQGSPARFQVDGEGAVVAASDAFRSLIGRETGDLVGRPVASILDDASGDRYGVAVDRLRSQGDLQADSVALGIQTTDGVLASTVRLLPLSAATDGLASVATVTAASGRAAVEESADDPTGSDEDASTHRSATDRVGGTTAARDGDDRQLATPTASGETGIPFRRVLQAIAGADTRSDLETGVCRALVDSPGYQFAWLGRERAGDGSVTLQTAAAVGETAVRDVAAQADDPPFGAGLADRALRTDSFQVGSICEADPVLEPSLEAVQAFGIGTLAAAPIRYGDARFGVLTVYHADPDGFDEREREALADLATAVGYAVSSRQARAALETERLTELELEIRDPESFLTQLTAATAAEVTLEGTVRHADDSLLLYATARGASAERITDLAAADPWVSRCRVVTELEDACVIELATDADDVRRLVSAHGGSVRTGVARDGVLTLTLAVPATSDTHEVVAGLDRLFEDVSLESQRVTDRPVETRQQFRQALSETLTDRQRAALRSAYHAGYFEWPRESTGEDVALSLGVSPPTFHKHLRLAERKVLRAVLDEGDDDAI
jgi:predicted DNA binding protein